MILVVQHVHLICVERMNVVQLWEPVNDFWEFFIDGGLREFDFSHVEFTNSGDFELMVDFCGGFTVCFWEDDVY